MWYEKRPRKQRAAGGFSYIIILLCKIEKSTT